MNKKAALILGAIYGDAFGAPYEFNRLPYTEELIYEVQHDGRFAKRSLPIASTTDDTGMMLTLLRSIVENNGYNREAVIEQYVEWAGHGGFLGNNTRNLLGNCRSKNPFTRYRHWEKQCAKVVDPEMLQSNGSLMRMMPLIFFPLEIALSDCRITNPSSINLSVCEIYWTACNLAIIDTPIDDILARCQLLARHEEINAIFVDIANNVRRSLHVKSGWSVTSLYVALYSLKYFTSFYTAAEWIVRDNMLSDTDTNACIAFALLAAYYGFPQDELTQRNLTKILLCENNFTSTDRVRILQPLKYRPFDILSLL